MGLPNWIYDAVFYQIFPDRFDNGSRQNDPDDAAPWGSEPDNEHYQGGDLKGVLKRLPYLEELGVNALYLNPVFASGAVHGYDTEDYLAVDPRLGTKEDLCTLVRECHVRGWHVILDGVFNHCGERFFAFQDVLKHGEESRYKDWFHIKEFPIRQSGEGAPTYETFGGFGSLPKFNQSNPETRDYLIGVATQWLKEMDLDGWRLDVAHEMDREFLRALRAALKRVNPDAFVVGEVVSMPDEFLGDMLDSATNYPWFEAARDFFARDKAKPSEFAARLEAIESACGDEECGGLFNALSNHDHPRLRTEAGGEVWKERQAALFQLTYCGVPCLYYGDEIGMEGGSDPDNRRAMVWRGKERDDETLDFYKRVLATRRDHPALRRGSCHIAVADDETGVFGVLRKWELERAVSLFNRSGEERCVTLSWEVLEAEATFVSWLDTGARIDQDAEAVKVTLPPCGLALIGP